MFSSPKSKEIPMPIKIHPLALFRLTVLGPIVSRGELAPGELKLLFQDLASKHYDIPNSRQHRLSEKTIERWYYLYKHEGVQGLEPKIRKDKGGSTLPKAIQDIILEAKRENLSRSVTTILRIIEQSGMVSKNVVSRSSIYRVLKNHSLSHRFPRPQLKIERRSFETQYAGEIWYGDVMHANFKFGQSNSKIYLVSLLDDASRFIAHSQFRLSEKAVDIEFVLKQAILKRGLPKKLVIDNGAAYRSESLQEICAHLGIQLIYCRAYEPEGKAKLERWHRTLREQFLSEVVAIEISTLDDLNARLWAWVEHAYHVSPHSGLEEQTPLKRWTVDIPKIKQLSRDMTIKIDEIFMHRVKRNIRRDGTITIEGEAFEVPYELSGLTVQVLVDPHTNKPKSIYSIEDNSYLGEVTPLDKIANSNRKRCRPHKPSSASSEQKYNSVEGIYEKTKKEFSVQIDEDK